VCCAAYPFTCLAELSAFAAKGKDRCHEMIFYLEERLSKVNIIDVDIGRLRV
jgi:hypothetical protein